VSGPPGPLLAALADALAAVPEGPDGVEVRVHEGGLDALRELSGSVIRARGTCLVVHEEMGTAIVGPWLIPGRPGCHVCLQTRQLAALHHDETELGIFRHLAEDRDSPPDAGWMAGPGRFFLAAIVAAEVAAMVSGGAPRAAEAVLAVRLDTLEVRRHPFLPHPLCPDCGDPPSDSPDAARLELRPVRKRHPRDYHTGSLGTLAERVEESCLDARYGVLTGWSASGPLNDEGILPVVTVALAAGHPGISGYGRDVDYRSATAVAMCEALERYGGLVPLARRTVIRASFAQLEPAAAVDPAAFGLPDHPDHPTVSYAPDLVVDWVWAYSFRSSGPVLVPQQLAYYGLPIAPEERFLTENSNGCALGATLEEAILHGILEVAERDAFLLTWHARLPAPRVDLASVRDPVTTLVVQRFPRAFGYEVTAFDITPPEGIPCFWVMATSRTEDPERPRAVCSAGSSLDPERGLRSALLELTAAMPHARRSYERDRERALRLLAEPDELTEMDDHRLVNSLPEAWPRFGFLQDRPARPLGDGFPDLRRPDADLDLTRDLRRVVGRYLDEGLDVLVVDQTAPEHLRLGLRCVKVLVPGALPMTFGHRNRRLGGLHRLRTAPVRMGYRSAPLSDSDVNHDPHPFP
jgi:ribosomal protein S12 methylthiotransferase accessory factor